MLNENCLPNHPASSNSYQKVLLQTNQYQVSLPEDCKVFIYILGFSPPIPSDNTKLKKILVRKSRKELAKYFDDFIHCGENIFSLKEANMDSPTSSGEDELTNSEVSSSGDSLETIKELKISCPYGDFTYEISINASGEVDLTEPSLIKTSTMQIFNISLRHKLKVLRLIQLGTNRNHYDPMRYKHIQGFPADIWPGYFTSINLLRDGLMLTIDCSFKLVRTDTVLDIINEYIRKFGPNCREILRSKLIDNIVITTYGSQSMYRICDILFDESPDDKFLYGSEEISFSKYFSSKYQACIKNFNQPLLLVKRTFKSETIKLIPELCRMTGAGGLQDDFRLKKEIAVHTRMRPEQRSQDIQNLANRLHQITEDHWGIQTSSHPVSVNGLKLAHPIIITRNKKLQINDKASFRLQDCTALKTMSLEKWQLFYIERDQGLALEFVNTLQNIGKGFGLQVKMPIMCGVPFMKNLDVAYTNSLKEKVRKEAQIVVIMLPRNNNGLYKAVKIVMTSDRPIPSQAVLVSSIEKRDMSVYMKLAVQILCKIGGDPWGVSIPKGLCEKTMLVGIDVCHNTFNAKQSVLGFCASLDRGFSKFYSKIAFHRPGQEISSVLTPVFLEALKQYYLFNGKNKPECIIIYRDGVGTSQYIYRSSPP